MRIKYLGTAAAEGWPALFCRCDFCKQARKLGGKNIRTRSQAIVDDTLLIDFPPDSYLHMLRDGVDLPSISDILITHTHEDHLFLDDLANRGRWFANEVDDVLTLHGNDRLAEKFAAFTDHGPDHEQLDGRVACREIAPYVPVSICGYTVTPMLARHDKHERCYIYLVEKDGRTLLYGNDTGYFPDETWAYLSGKRLSLVSLDCTCLIHKEGDNHMGIEDVLQVQQRLLEMGSATDDTTFVVTHFSHNGQLLHDDIVARMTPHRFLVAYDGMEVSF